MLLSRPRITSIVFAGVLISTAASVLIGTGLWFSYQNYREAVMRDRFATAVVTAAFQLTTLTGDYLLYREDRAATQWVRKHESLGELLQSPGFRPDKGDRNIPQLRRDHSVAGKFFARATNIPMENQDSGNFPEANVMYEKRLLTALLTTTQAMVSQASLLSKRNRLVLDAAIERTTQLILGFGLLLMVLFLGLWFVLVRRVVLPIRELKIGIDAFGAGDLDHRLLSRHADEIGEVAIAFNEMAERLRETLVSRDELVKEVADRRQAESYLRESEANLNKAQSIAGLGSWLVNLSAGKAKWSDERYRIFGYEPGAIEPTINSFEKSLHPEDRERVMTEMNGAVRTGEILDTECRIIRPSGEERLVHILGEVTQNGYGATEIIAGTVLDITERRNIEQQFAASQKMEALGQMAGGVAHEFNNLFMAISANLELIRDDVPPRSDAEKRIDTLIGIVHRGGELTQSMLSYVGHQRLTTTAVDIEDAISQSIKMLRPMLGEGHTLQFEPHGDIWSAVADVSGLQNAIINLVTNARDAMPEGGTITIRTRNIRLDETNREDRPSGVSVGDYVQLSVIDRGEGMPPEVRKRALDPFFTTKDVGKGTGLGLSMVYGFVNQLGGYVDIVSEQGLGTTVSLFLPCTGDARAKPAGTSDVGAGKTSAQHGIVALVVEDEPVVLDAITAFLEKEGFTVHQAKDGDEAMAIVRELGLIDLLVSDIVIPGSVNGVVLADWINKNNPSSHFILMTGYTNLAIEQMGISLENMHVLRKPFKKADLFSIIESVLPCFTSAGSED